MKALHEADVGIYSSVGEDCGGESRLGSCAVDVLPRGSDIYALDPSVILHVKSWALKFVSSAVLRADRTE